MTEEEKKYTLVDLDTMRQNVWELYGDMKYKPSNEVYSKEEQSRLNERREKRKLDRMRKMEKKQKINLYNYDNYYHSN